MDLDVESPSDVPPIPVRSHRQAQRRSIHAATAATGLGRRQSAVSSPDVINNLISSLSVISQPAASHFESHLNPSGLASPVSPVHSPQAASKAPGSFGVDYGAYNKASIDDLQPGDSLDELAATSPVVRTSKPRATTQQTSSRDSGGVKSFIRGGSVHSRPSSPGSLGSKNDDARSIGNLSIEPGTVPAPELRSRRSHDSWGKKASRTGRGLLYATSKERLRDRDSFDRNRWAPSTAGTASGSGANDPFIAETTIREEPAMHDNLFTGNAHDGAQAIPTRDSSLRSGRSKKRSSERRSGRNSDSQITAAILEADEQGRFADRSHTTSERHLRTDSEDARKMYLQYDGLVGNKHAENGLKPEAIAEEDAAPSPGISTGRKKWERKLERRSSSALSGRLSPSPAGVLDKRRSIGRNKRLPELPSDDGAESRLSEQRSLPAGYDRPRSADSVDDAVESYLCSPRLSQKIRHPQTGRLISFSEVGDSEGSAVFCCVGMGLTRYITAFYDELALTLRLRLITPDRPGVGDSEAYSDGTATPLNWPDDVYAICQALKITKFSIMAHSAGAIYALATALRMPQHIRGKIHLLAPWIPPSQMNVFGTSQVPPTNVIPTSQRILRALPTPLLKAANSSFMSATSTSITTSLPKSQRRSRRKPSGQNKDTPSRNTAAGMDQENAGQYGQADRGAESGGEFMSAPNATENMDCMQRPSGTMGGDHGDGTGRESEADKERQMTYDMRLTQAIWELATTGANPAVDLLVCLERRHTIGFRYVDITRPVIIHHGSRDARVPVENVKWLGKAMRRCEVRVLEGEGHGLMASAMVMGSVLMEMSKEWEDWMRVTRSDTYLERDSKGRRVPGR